MNQLDNFNPLNSAELAVFGTALSDNFSNGLSISESNKVLSRQKKLILPFDIVDNYICIMCIHIFLLGTTCKRIKW